MDADVLIVGAGPTGLVLALWLTKMGVTLRIIDKAAEPGTTSRAMLVQARTLELYRQLGLADTVVSKAQKMLAMNVWAEGTHRVRLPFGALGEGLTPYPFLEVFPQDQHEQLLAERLEALGVAVERETEVLAFTDHGTHVSARVRGPDGDEQALDALYIVGCDGARSLVRTTIGAEFPGGTYRQVFYVADIEAHGASMNGEAHVDFQPDDFLLLFPVDGGSHARLIGTVSDDRADRAETLTFDDVSTGPIEALKLTVEHVNWFSTYRVHHRVADRFRRGRAFIAGDAGHIHSPAGGQGMNTGIGDAINLAWKLAALVHDQAGDWLLDTYESERLPFARRLVNTTDRVFSFATADGHFAEVVRTRIAPTIMSLAVRMPAVPELLFRMISQTMINYRDSPLSEGIAGSVRGGDRLPWVEVDGRDNFEPLTSVTWQVHVYGAPDEDLVQWCASRNLPLQVFEWTRKHGEAGLLRDAAYLLRPDTYVAYAHPRPAAEELEAYITARGMSLAV